MLCDYYELTMANGYYRAGMSDSITYFDMFFRDIPDGGGFAIAAGLEQLIEYINNLEFTDEDIEYLRSKNVFDEAFLEKLKTFRFTGDIYAIPEGTPIFPGEPIITVRAPAAEAQFIETYLLLTVNHRPRRQGACDLRVRQPPRTGCRRRIPRRTRRVHRRLRRHRLHDHGS